MLLRKAADDMAPQWLLIPNFMPCQSDSTKVLRDTVRIMDQLTHYHMLNGCIYPTSFPRLDKRTTIAKLPPSMPAAKFCLAIMHSALRILHTSIAAAVISLRLLPSTYFVFLTSTPGASSEDLRTRMRSLFESLPTAARVTVAPWSVP